MSSEIKRESINNAICTSNESIIESLRQKIMDGSENSDEEWSFEEAEIRYLRTIFRNLKKKISPGNLNKDINDIYVDKENKRFVFEGIKHIKATSKRKRGRPKCAKKTPLMKIKKHIVNSNYALQSRMITDLDEDLIVNSSKDKDYLTTWSTDLINKRGKRSYRRSSQKKKRNLDPDWKATLKKGIILQNSGKIPKRKGERKIEGFEREEPLGKELLKNDKDEVLLGLDNRKGKDSLCRDEGFGYVVKIEREEERSFQKNTEIEKNRLEQDNKDIGYVNTAGNDELRSSFDGNSIDKEEVSEIIRCDLKIHSVEELTLKDDDAIGFSMDVLEKSQWKVEGKKEDIEIPTIEEEGERKDDCPSMSVNVNDESMSHFDGIKMNKFDNMGMLPIKENRFNELKDNVDQFGLGNGPTLKELESQLLDVQKFYINLIGCEQSSSNLDQILGNDCQREQRTDLLDFENKILTEDFKFNFPILNIVDQEMCVTEANVGIGDLKHEMIFLKDCGDDVRNGKLVTTTTNVEIIERECYVDYSDVRDELLLPERKDSENTLCKDKNDEL